MKKLQHNYYENTHAKNTIQSRIDSIKEHTDMHMSVLDIGCNDGSISKNISNRIVGVDLEKVAPFKVIVKDLSKDSFVDLPQTDVFLCLNILHHIQNRANELIDHLLENHLFGFIDMGSVTEKGEWNWLKKLKEKYNSDDELFKDLFRNAYYEKILEYPAQGGTRKLFKIWKKDNIFKIENVYRRNVAGSANKKKLIEVSSLSDKKEIISIDDNMLCPYVCFFKIGIKNDLFWAKKHLGNTVYNSAPSKKELLDQFLKTLPYNIQTPLFRHPQFGEIYKYEDNLFKGKALHLNHVYKYNELTESEIQYVESFAETVIDIEGFKNLKIKELVDFQTIKTEKGLTFIDFDLNPGIL
jgi:hypothetical protein